MTELAAWLWLPLVGVALALGAGLLAERVSGARVPEALLAPLGVAALLVLVTPVYRLGAGAAVAAPIAVLAGLAGLILARRSLLTRLRPGWGAAAALAAYALYLAPVVLAGHWTWPGYEFVNDTAANLIFADYVGSHGIGAVPPIDSSTASIAANAIDLKYPLGAHFLLATLQPLSGAPLAAAYQPVIGLFAATVAAALFHLARRAGLPGPAAALAGFVAVASNLLYRYLQHGAIKEILVVALLATAAALAYEALDRRADARTVALVALAVAPLPAVFSATGAIYGLLLAATAGVAVILLRSVSPRKLATVGAVGLTVAMLAALPTLADTVSFGRNASQTFASSGGSSTAYLGQLVRPLPVTQAAGVWFARDYREPLKGNAVLPTSVLIGVVIAFMALGIAYEVRRRRLASLLLLFPLGVGAAVLAPGLSPYADAKLLVVLSPAVVLTAAVGVWALWGAGRWGRVVAGVAAAAISVGVLWSAAYAYREVQLAPPERMDAMEDAAEHARGGGLWLVNEWEEYAKHFMDDVRVNAAFEAESPRAVKLRNEKLPIFGRWYDLDDQRISYVTSFPGIIKRRSPDASRPPANFRMIHRNDYYEVWRRQPGLRVRAHLPLQARYRPALTPRCRDVRGLASRARAGDTLVAARRPSLPLLDTVRSRRSRGWVRRFGFPGVVIPTSPGEARGSARTGAGRHSVWVRGTFGRRVTAGVDGRPAGSVKAVNTPGQWLLADELQLRPGRHELVLSRGGVSLRPGDAYRGFIGPLALEPAGGRSLVRVPPSQADRLCGRPWDWIELVSRSS